MKMRRFSFIFPLILVAIILIGFPDTLFSENEDLYKEIIKYKKETREEKIDTLQSLEILQGNGLSLDLDKQLTRAEGSSIYFRLMGLDEEAETFKKANPNYNTGFTDIPTWAIDNIDYLHSQKIVHGVTLNSFGSSNIMTAEEFTTLILRGLGYKDMEEGFRWDESLEKALEIGLITSSEKSYIEKDDIFTREKMALITYNSLFQKHNTNKTIILFDRQNSIGHLSRIFYTKLDSAEVIEISRALKDETYTIFKDSPEQKDNLYNKLYAMVSKVNDIFNVEYKGERLNIEVLKVTELLISAKHNEIFIKFDTRNLDTDEIIKSSAKLIMKNSIMSIKSDEDYGKVSSIIWSILENKYPNNISNLVYLKNNPMNPWDSTSSSNYESFELDEANILDINKNSLGKIIIYNPRKSLDIYFDIYFNEEL